MSRTNCEHTFSYLLKDYNGVHTGRVLEIPSVIVSGTPEEIEEKIVKATKAYLEFNESDHERADQLVPTLQTPHEGVVIQTKKFNVKC